MLIKFPQVAIVFVFIVFTAPTFAQSVALSPTGNQTVVQPGGTVLYVNNFQTKYAHWMRKGDSSAYDVGITNPSTGLFSFDSTTDGDGAAVARFGSLMLTAGLQGGLTFSDGTVQTTAYHPTAACPAGGDYAESVGVSGEKSNYEPGSLLEISGSDGSDVALTREPYSRLVAGIYSTRPGYIGRRQLTPKDEAKTEVPMAMVGIVPTKISAENGPIHRGDLLVSSSLPGVAMKGTDRRRMLGAVVGKALGNFESGVGVIEVLVTLQ